MNKILVTGATGFIGSHLTEYLVQKDLMLLPLTGITLIIIGAGSNIQNI